MLDYNRFTSRCRFLPALRKLLSRKRLQLALATTGRKFRSRIIPAEAVLMAMVAGFIQGSLGLAAVVDWLNFNTVAGQCSLQALYQMRARIGWRPLRWLRSACVEWLACEQSDPAAFFHGHRVLIADGTTLTTADTLENQRSFARAKNQYKQSGFPLIRLAALCEMGTRALVHWVARGFQVSEQVLLQKLLRFIPPNALLLGDRNFHNGNLWESARKQGFFMLLRLQAGPQFPVQEALSDGSYLSRVIPRRGRKKQQRGIIIRIIVGIVRIDDKVVHIRLITNLLDPNLYPARDLLALYGKRWEIELAFRELKQQLCERDTQLRAETPLGVMAELDGLMIGHYVVRSLALDAARQEQIDPLSISFSQVIRTMCCAVVHQRMSRCALLKAIARRANKRRQRRVRRCRKIVRCKWPTKQAEDRTTQYNELVVTVVPQPALS
jgi:hypothetical protein